LQRNWATFSAIHTRGTNPYQNIRQTKTLPPSGDYVLMAASQPSLESTPMKSLQHLLAAACIATLASCATKKADDCCKAASDDCCKIKSSCCAGESHKPKK